MQAKYRRLRPARDEIAGGAKAEVFASANMAHPQSLAKAGKSGPVVLFARNRLCALVRPGLAVTPATLLDRMLARRGEARHVDAEGRSVRRLCVRGRSPRPRRSRPERGALEKKALQLTGGATSAAAAGRPQAYGWHIAEGRADIFLAYCTAAAVAQRENTRPADRRAARCAGGRRRLWADRHERCFGGGLSASQCSFSRPTGSVFWHGTDLPRRA